jgi:hypothetical protein
VAISAYIFRVNFPAEQPAHGASQNIYQVYEDPYEQRHIIIHRFFVVEMVDQCIQQGTEKSRFNDPCNIFDQNENQHTCNRKFELLDNLCKSHGSINEVSNLPN